MFSNSSIQPATAPPPPRPAASAPDTAAMPRGLEFAMFLTAMAWTGAANSIASRASSGLIVRFNLPGAQGLLQSVFLLFLVFLGYSALDLIATRGTRKLDPLPLPKRATRWQEWGTGAALGWALTLAVVVPVLISGNLHGKWNALAGNVFPILLAGLTFLLATLAEEAIFRGYPFQRLTRAVGPSWAAAILSAGFAFFLLSGNSPHNVLLAFADAFLLGLLLALAYLRTHGLWLGWGLHFGYRVVMAVLIGLPVAGRGAFGSLLDAYTSGPYWLSGGAFGLDSALLTLIVLALAIPVLYRVSRDWAWRYTHREIVAGGYEVVVAPPAAHVAMEKSAAAAPPPLVQILPSTPQGTFAARDDVRQP